MRDEEHLISGCSDGLLMHKFSFNLIIGRHALACSPKPSFNLQNIAQRNIIVVTFSNLFLETTRLLHKLCFSIIEHKSYSYGQLPNRVG